MDATPCNVLHELCKLPECVLLHGLQIALLIQVSEICRLARNLSRVPVTDEGWILSLTMSGGLRGNEEVT
jgi:hypothetical protein